MEQHYKNSLATEDEILNYVFMVNDCSEEKRSIHIYHKIKELLYVRRKDEVLIKQNVPLLASYSDLIERMKLFYDENKKCLLARDMRTISFNLFKCLERCLNDLYVEGNNIYPLFNLNVSELLKLKIYDYVSSQHMRLFLFLYLEKFLYSFPRFAYERNLSEVPSKGFFLFNLDNLSQDALEDFFFYLLVEDVNYVVSIIAPIYFHSIVFYKSQQLRDKFYKIFKLIQNKNCANVFLETEEELHEVVQPKDMYSQLEIGRRRTRLGRAADISRSNIICDHSNFFLLRNMFQGYHNEYNMYQGDSSEDKGVLSLFDYDSDNGRLARQMGEDVFFICIDFDDTFIREHENYKNMRLLVKRAKIEKAESSDGETHYAPHGNLTDTERNSCALTQNGEECPENELWPNIFSMDYMKKLMTDFNHCVLMQKQIEKEIGEFIMKVNNYENEITNKRRNSNFHVGSITVSNKKKLKKKKKRIYVDLKKTKGNGNVNTCMNKDNRNYINHVDSSLRNAQNENVCMKQPETIATDFTYKEIPYEINKNSYSTPSIEVTKKSLQLRGFH